MALRFYDKPSQGSFLGFKGGQAPCLARRPPCRPRLMSKKSCSLTFLFQPCEEPHFGAQYGLELE
jgi:hypothetical protein